MKVHMLSAVIRWKKRRKVTKHQSTSLLHRLAFLLAYLAALVIINSVVMVLFEGMSTGDALWLSSTTITTVGYGDFSPSTLLGRLTTIICMYAFGIAVLSQIVGELIDWQSFRRERMRKGYWEWKDMQNHILIINTPNRDTEKYLNRLVTQIRATPALAEDHIQIVTRKYSDGLPESLIKQKVVHATGTAEDNDVLKSVNVDQAKCIIVLARDESDSISDSLTFDVLSRINEIGTDALVLAESTADANRDRLKRAGADVVLRPIRAYPELLVRAISSPGTESVMENLFSHEGDRLERFNVDFEVESWGELVCRFVKKGLGVPMGYIAEGEVKTNPPVNDKCSGNAIICMVGGEEQITQAHVINALAAA